jgi:glycosyltransferase involved in cell wall biosynthesis
VNVVQNPYTEPEAVVARHRSADGPLRLGFIGQVSAHKGFDLLLEALDGQPSGTRLVVAGNGPLAGAAGAHPLVDYLGVVSGEAKERFFASIDVLIAPTRTDAETAGLVIDEAAGRGVPVIASIRGGMSEYVPPSCRSLLIDPDVPTAVADAIARFASGPDSYPVGPPTGRSWAEHLQQVEAVYAMAIDEAGISPARA